MPRYGTTEPKPCARAWTGASVTPPKKVLISSVKLPDLEAFSCKAWRRTISAWRSGVYFSPSVLDTSPIALEATFSAPNTSVKDLPAPSTPCPKAIAVSLAEKPAGLASSTCLEADSVM